MKVESLTCNNCGAPLEIAETTKFATCTHCGSRLSITRTGGAAYTEVLAQIGQHTEQMSGDLTAIRLHNELDRLDSEWQKTRERWQSQLSNIAATVKGASTFDKGPLMSIMLPAMSIMLPLVGILVFIALVTSNATLGGVIIPIVLILVAFGAIKRVQDLARRHNDWRQHYEKQLQLFSDAEQDYNSKRADIIRRLEHA